MHHAIPEEKVEKPDSLLSFALLNARTCLRAQELTAVFYYCSFSSITDQIPTHRSDDVPSSFLLLAPSASLSIPETTNPLDVDPLVPLCPAPPSNTNGPALFLGVIGPSACNATPGASAYCVVSGLEVLRDVPGRGGMGRGVDRLEEDCTS
jgi:hypothetical protein